jgi:UDP-glucose 4-epimerase
MKTILVTGSEGFIGKALCLFLTNNGYSVIRYDIVNGLDVLDKETLNKYLGKNIDVVIHLASPSSAAMFYYKPHEMWRLAVEGTNNIINNFNGRVIFPSTCTLYGDISTPAKEQNILPIPPNLYAASKIECERICLHKNSKDGDIKILRIFSGYGDDEKHKDDYASPIYKFICSALSYRKVYLYGKGSQVRDFIYVDDISRIIHKLVETNVSDSIFNAGTGFGTSFIKLIDIIQFNINYAIEIEYLALPKGYVTNIIADTSLASNILEFSSQTTIDNGIKKIVEGTLND